MIDWQGKKVIVIGAARQGLAASRFLANQGANVILTDSSPNPIQTREIETLAKLGIKTKFGAHPESLLEGAYCLCISGGVPLDIPFIQKAGEKGIPLTNDAQLFFDNVQAHVIGITGSAGKTTTTTLIGSIAHEDAKNTSKKVWVGGNIGNPLVEDLNRIKQDDTVVMELSSFQLELMHSSPEIALVLNITPNHLDRHKTMQAYGAAKSNILRFQNESDIAVLNREDKGSIALAEIIKGELITFGVNRPTGQDRGTFVEDDQIMFADEGQTIPIMPLDEMHLIGHHNHMNALAASAAGFAAKFSIEAIRNGVRNIEGIPHRLELVRENEGVRWYNDSIATAPERVLAALNAMEGPLVLLLGGRDKDLPWEALVSEIQKRRPKVILFGEAGKMIEDVFVKQAIDSGSTAIYRYKTLEEAVIQAAKITESGDAVLLSPGGTSYDAFKDFEERGNLFRTIVEGLA